MPVIVRNKGYTRVAGKHAEILWMHSNYSTAFTLELPMRENNEITTNEDGASISATLEKWTEIRDMLSMLIKETQEVTNYEDNLGDYQKDELKEDGPDYDAMGLEASIDPD